jgi:hypothetical protein
MTGTWDSATHGWVWGPETTQEGVWTDGAWV